MQNELNCLTQTLRDELTQYRAMLTRLEQTQQVVQNRSGNGPSLLTSEIKIQCLAVHRAQFIRTQASRDLAKTLHLTEANPMEVMIPLLPTDYQPLIGRLYRENRELMGQVVCALMSKMTCNKSETTNPGMPRSAAEIC